MSFPMFRPIRKIMPWRVTLGLAQGSFCLLLHSHFILQFTFIFIYAIELNHLKQVINHIQKTNSGKETNLICDTNYVPHQS